jgi:microcystin degradation protein MlrC
LSALLEIGEIRLLVMSSPTYDWADEQFRSMGLQPGDAKFIGVKNPMNYRFAYREIAKAAFVVDTPGPTPAVVRQLPFERIEHPIFPFEERERPPRMDTAHRIEPRRPAEAPRD